MALLTRDLRDLYVFMRLGLPQLPIHRSFLLIQDLTSTKASEQSSEGWKGRKPRSCKPALEYAPAKLSEGTAVPEFLP